MVDVVWKCVWRQELPPPPRVYTRKLCSLRWTGTSNIYSVFRMLISRLKVSKGSCFRLSVVFEKPSQLWSFLMYLFLFIDYLLLYVWLVFLVYTSAPTVRSGSAHCVLKASFHRGSVRYVDLWWCSLESCGASSGSSGSNRISHIAPGWSSL